MRPFRHWLDLLASRMQTASRLIARAAGLLLLLMALAISLNAIARTLPGVSPALPIELLGYGMAITASWALAYTLHERAHVRIALLSSVTPARWQTPFEVLALAALAFVAVALAATAADVAMASAETGRLANASMQIAMALPQGLWALGLIWFALNTVIVLLRLIVHR